MKRFYFDITIKEWLPDIKNYYEEDKEYIVEAKNAEEAIDKLRKLISDQNLNCNIIINDYYETDGNAIL